MKVVSSHKYYNPNKSPKISVDATSFALGAILLQDVRLISFSCTALNEVQESYSQMEKDAWSWNLDDKIYIRISIDMMWAWRLITSL